MEGWHVSTRMRSSIREEGDSVDVRLTHRHSDNRGIASTYFIRARLMKECTWLRWSSCEDLG